MTASRPRLADLVRIVTRRFYDDRCMQIASSLTFTSLLALVPVLTVALTVISAFPVFGDLTTTIQSFVANHLMPASADAIVTCSQQFSVNAAKLTAFGVAFLALTAVLLLFTIDRAFNLIWGVKRPRPILQRIFIYGTIITLGPILIGASLSLTSWVVGQAVGLVTVLPGAGFAVLTIVPIVLTSAALTLLYFAMPNCRVPLGDAIIGGVIAGSVFEVTKRVFGLYVAHFANYKLVYGAFAAVPVFLLWIYLSWLVVVFGAVLVASLPEWRRRAVPRP